VLHKVILHSQQKTCISPLPNTSRNDMIHIHEAKENK